MRAKIKNSISPLSKAKSTKVVGGRNIRTKVTLFPEKLAKLNALLETAILLPR